MKGPSSDGSSKISRLKKPLAGLLFMFDDDNHYQ